MSKVCSKKGCSNPDAPHKFGTVSSYCTKHFRFIMMRNNARAAGKAIPSYSQLESYLHELKGFHCPTCGVKMVWKTVRGEDKSNVISLQHWRNGRMSFICMLCNNRHGTSKLGDDRFSAVNDGQKFCCRCDTVKRLEEFHIDSRSRDQRQRWCKPCAIFYKNTYKKIQIRKRLSAGLRRERAAEMVNN